MAVLGGKPFTAHHFCRQPRAYPVMCPKPLNLLQDAKAGFGTQCVPEFVRKYDFLYITLLTAQMTQRSCQVGCSQQIIIKA